jgi:hypothetical protein
MVRAFGICAFALASGAWAGTAPKPKPGDYPVQARVGDIEIAAEYLVHTLPAEGANFLVPNHLVVEIAVYPPKSPTVTVEASQFRLRVNGKRELLPETPEMVAMSLKYPDWEGHKGFDTQVGLGPVILGRPGVGQGPGPPTAPVDQPANTDRPPQQTAPEAAVALAFPDGPCERPASGYVYFRYDGKMKSIKSLELLWQQGEKQTAIRLF